MAISAVQPLQPAQGLDAGPAPQPAAPKSGDFQSLLGNVVNDFNQVQNQAADEIANLAAGKTDNVHQVMIALGKADVSFNYMLEVRNRLLDAYKQVMEMPV